MASERKVARRGGARSMKKERRGKRNSTERERGSLVGSLRIGTQQASKKKKERMKEAG